ncbi:MAG: YfiR family protein [Bacteroidota bacterium]|nr:YfiR family protein [Bacteroidota bacterium]
MKKIISIVILVLLFFGAEAQESKFQAMSIYDFTRMLQWPQDYREGNFNIKVIGDSDIYDEIKTFTLNKRVRGVQKIVVAQASIDNIGKCHILVVGESESENLSLILNNTKTKGTLIVTQEKGLTPMGAGISFIKNGKGRYNYNLANIANNKIAVSTSFKQIGVEN